MKETTKKMIEELQSALRDSSLSKAEYARVQAVMMSKHKIKREMIAKTTGKSLSVVEDWITQYNKEGLEGLRTKKRETQPRSKLTNEERERLCKLLKKKPSDLGISQEDYWGINEVKKLVKKETGLEYKSESSYRNLLDEAGLSYQKVEFVDKHKSKEAHDGFKKQFKAKIKKRGYIDVVVEDECKIQREPNSFYRWSVKGETPVVRVDRKKGDAVSFYGGLSLKTKEVITYKTQEHQNSHETCHFLNKIKKRYKGKGKVLLVWDGARHHMGAVKDWLEKNPGVVELYKFPSYCPDLNPQEHVWKSLRAYLSKIIHKVSYEELIKKANNFLNGHLFDYDFGVTTAVLI